jgi:hypothetical protein
MRSVALHSFRPLASLLCYDAPTKSLTFDGIAATHPPSPANKSLSNGILKFIAEDE